MFLLINNYSIFTQEILDTFASAGIELTLVGNDSPDLLPFASDPRIQGVCISGGPGRPEAVESCFAFLEKLPASTPVFGICLGHQILGRAAGATIVDAVEAIEGKAVEITHDGCGIFERMKSPLSVARYNRYMVEAPEGLEHPAFRVTARNECGEVMALEYRDRPWIGVQFHPEAPLTPEGQFFIKEVVRVLFSSPQ